MRHEFTELEEKAKKTAKWARPLLKEFDRIFNEEQHCCESKVTSTVTSLPPEKSIRVITQPSKKNKSARKEDSSVRDFIQSKASKSKLQCPKACQLNLEGPVYRNREALVEQNENAQKELQNGKRMQEKNAEEIQTLY